MLKVLRICNNYFGTMLYPELIEGLLEYDIDSHVLVVLPKNKNTIGLVAVNPNVTVVLIPNVINMIAKIFPINLLKV